MEAALLSRNLIVCLAGLWLSTAGAPAQQPPAGADDGKPNALSTLLPHQKDRVFCYASSGAPVTYPIEDLPKRKKPRTLEIRRFVFQFASRRHDDDDTTNPPTPGKFYYEYGLMGEVAGKRQRLFAAGECGSENLRGFGCGVECDGGVVHFKPLAGTDSLQMRISDTARRFRMTWGCGGEGEEGGRSEVLTYDPATPAVRFDRADLKVCARIEKLFRREQ
jgi:hypothetical protein